MMKMNEKPWYILEIEKAGEDMERITEILRSMDALELRRFRSRNPKIEALRQEILAPYEELFDLDLFEKYADNCS